MTKLRVGGVPEHFNLPWHLALENGLFKSKGIDVEWLTFKGGTGAMCRALRNNEVDLCVILTEGIVNDIIAGNPSKIISKYIETPLIWGVHTGAESDVNYYGEIFKKKIAISRKGSGSHLMPQVDAMLKKKEIDEDQFVVIKNLEGALTSLSNSETEVFYWEKYTTKPYVDSGQLRSLGEFVTPWPCFVIAATDKVLNENPEVVSKLLETIQFVCGQFVKMPNVLTEISQRYEQKVEDVENWFHSTEWSSSSIVREKMIENVIHALKRAGLVEMQNKINVSDVIFDINETQ